MSFIIFMLMSFIGDSKVNNDAREPVDLHKMYTFFTSEAVAHTFVACIIGQA